MLISKPGFIGMDRFNKLAKMGMIKKKGAELAKAIFFSKVIIITALLPIFSFQKVEGKLFSPLRLYPGFRVTRSTDFYTYAGTGTRKCSAE